ncbi:uncharacterized protein LOC118278255 isoform X1 [Spodoptera frugiperda]|uniref:Uncharacterized protein LOC118278255 isoform X1 n=1 Tax=Spodoptera frugiperda TaxID=7108 RepID=A0A9R0DZX3_SPOFR|nr:uncharacterized protein LOC118278255 isoform X1 [Spodoptera frugiperda]
MATYAQFKHVELYKIGHGKNRVPNAPKSCIAEIFNADQTDGSPVKNGATKPRVVRDTPTRPRDTHSRLFGQVRQSQAVNNPVSPMVTDTIRSHIQFGDSEMNGSSPTHSPSKMGNGSATSTPSRATYGPPKRNPVTGDGVAVPPQRRRHPAASQRGADPDDPNTQLLHPQPTHRYFTRDWPPKPANYYVESTMKPSLTTRITPYTLLGLASDDPEVEHPVIDPDSLSPQLVLNRHWPPFPAQHYLEPKEHKIPYHPLPPYAFVGMHSALGERPTPDYKYDPIPTLDGPIDPYLIANTDPPPTLFKYERDGPIPDVIPLQTALVPGPHTLTGFPPIFHKHVPGYLFDRNRHAEDFRPKTYYVDYVRRREMGGCSVYTGGMLLFSHQ